MPTIQQQINQLKKDKETLNTMLNTMGVETTGNETFTQLTPLVGKIVTDPILQDKTIEITENGTTNIVADEGYDGLYNVEVITNIEGGEVKNEKQYADTLVRGSLNPSSPPSYINTVNKNRAQYIGFDLKIVPGKTYRFVGQSGYNYEPRQINDDVRNAMENKVAFPSVWELGGQTWSGHEFIFKAVEGAKYFWFNVKDANDPEKTIDITKALPVYIQTENISTTTQCVQTLQRGTIIPTPPQYLNYNNINRGVYIGSDIKLTPGKKYKITGQANYTYRVLQTTEDIVTGIKNDQTFSSESSMFIADSGYVSSSFEFTAVDNAKYMWIMCRLTSNGEANIVPLKTVPIYVEELE